MPDAKQQQPKDLITTVLMKVDPGIYEYKTLDVLAMAGYSKTLGRDLIKRDMVWQPFDGNWVLTNWRCWVNFLTRESDLVLAIQPQPYYEGSRVLDRAYGMRDARGNKQYGPWESPVMYELTKSHPEHKLIYAKRGQNLK